MSAKHRAGARSILRCTSLPRRLPIGARCAAPPAVNSLCPAGLQRGGARRACELGKEGDSAELTNSLIHAFARCVSAISSVMLLPAAASHAATSQGGLSRPRQGPGDRPQVGAQGKARNAARTPAWPGGHACWAGARLKLGPQAEVWIICCRTRAAGEQPGSAAVPRHLDLRREPSAVDKRAAVPCGWAGTGEPDRRQPFGVLPPVNV